MGEYSIVLYIFIIVTCTCTCIVRDHVHRNKLPWEFLYDAKPPIQTSQGHPEEQKKKYWQSEICDEVYKKFITFYLADFGIEHKKHPEDIFTHFWKQ